MSDILIQRADALQWLPEAALSMAGEIPLIVTDPPYWTLEKWRKIGTTTRLGGHKDPARRDGKKWFSQTIDQQDLWQVLGWFYDLMAKDAFAYIFCDHEVMPIILGYVRDGGLSYTYSKPLVWDKVHPGLGYHWRACHEYVVLLKKGRARLRNRAPGDVFHVPRLMGKGHYPTEKPLPLIRAIVENSSDENDTVLDPFCGSGVVGAACYELGRHGILLDIEERAVEWSKRRLAECEKNLFADPADLARG